MTVCIVDGARCDALAALVLGLGNFPPDGEDPQKINLTEKELSTVALVTVATNHQTTPLHGQHLIGEIDGKTARGWDYLWRKWIQVTEQNPVLAWPYQLSLMTPERLATLLADGKGGGQITDIERRASHIVDIGKIMMADGYETPFDMYEEADGRIGATDKVGLRGLLRKFDAFRSDPLEKKSRYLLALLKNTCGWKYVDPENLGTPVDYHESRLHLRLGTVVLLDDALRERLVNREPVTQEEDLAIRGAVMEAISRISYRLGVIPSQAHYAFWNIARNACPRDATHCEKLPEKNGLPERYRLPTVQGCMFAGVCASRGQDVKTLPVEHSFETDWY